MNLSVFEKDSGLRTMVQDALYNVECPLTEEVYVRKAILKLKKVCDELPKHNYKGIDKNGIKLDKIEVEQANVSPNYLNVAHEKNRIIANAKACHSRGKTYFIMAAASIIERVLICNEKSKDGYYYYCEQTDTPIPGEYFQGYYGVQLVDIRIVEEKAGLYGPEYTYCYTFTKMENN